MKAIRFHKAGGPDVLSLEDVDFRRPAANQVRVRHTAIGVNFIDTYHRSGLYKLPLPSGLGSEAAGHRRGAGRRRDHAQGRRPRRLLPGAIGAYAEANNVPADRLVKLPAGVSDETAAAAMLKGMTAQYLLKRTYSGEAGPDHPVSCRRRRRRTDRRPMGETSGRHRHRHGRLRRQSRARQAEWLRPCAQHAQRRLGEARARDHGRRRACRSSTIPSARTPSPARSTASPCAA